MMHTYIYLSLCIGCLFISGCSMLPPDVNSLKNTSRIQKDAGDGLVLYPKVCFDDACYEVEIADDGEERAM